MMIPFVDFVISKDNFNIISSFENVDLKIDKVNNDLVLSFKNTYPSNFYYYINDNNYYLSLNEKTLYKFIKTEFNITCEFNDDYLKWENAKKEYEEWRDNGKQGIEPIWHKLELSCNMYKEIQRISKLYDNIVIHSDCSFDVNYSNENSVNTVPIREAGNIVKEWIIKYKQLISSIPSDQILIDLSAGFDTRTLTWFWRYNNQKYNVLSSSDLELTYVNNFKDKLPINTLMKEKDRSYYTRLSGIGNQTKEFITIDEFENYRGLHFCRRVTQYISPFLDKEYLKIKGDYPSQVKYVVHYLLAKDLIDFPYMSYKNEIVNFKDMIDIKECEDIINNYWKINIDELK